MRLDRVTRFLATRLFGGKVLENASWDMARVLLEEAERGDPCLPDHHWELAGLYAERGEPEAAERERQHVEALQAVLAERVSEGRRRGGLE